jgi:hypothetical protein
MSNKIANNAINVMGAAAKVVGSERGNQHGGAENSFQMIADFWSTYLTNTNRMAYYSPQPSQHIDVPDIIIRQEDVALMMDLLKTARRVHGDPKNADNFVDKVGYSALAAGLGGVEVRREESVGQGKPPASPVSVKSAQERVDLEALRAEAKIEADAAAAMAAKLAPKGDANA